MNILLKQAFKKFLKGLPSFILKYGTKFITHFKIAAKLIRLAHLSFIGMGVVLTIFYSNSTLWSMSIATMALLLRDTIVSLLESIISVMLNKEKTDSNGWPIPDVLFSKDDDDADLNLVKKDYKGRSYSNNESTSLLNDYKYYIIGWAIVSLVAFGIFYWYFTGDSSSTPPPSTPNSGEFRNPFAGKDLTNVAPDFQAMRDQEAIRLDKGKDTLWNTFNSNTPSEPSSIVSSEPGPSSIVSSDTGPNSSVNYPITEAPHSFSPLSQTVYEIQQAHSEYDSL